MSQIWHIFVFSSEKTVSLSLFNDFHVIIFIIFNNNSLFLFKKIWGTKSTFLNFEVRDPGGTARNQPGKKLLAQVNWT